MGLIYPWTSVYIQRGATIKAPDMEPLPPVDFVSQIQGWLIPSNDMTTASSLPKGSPGSTFTSRQRDYIAAKLSFKGSPATKDMISASSKCSSQSEDVLQFWFGGDKRINYKTKWFPDGSAETQRKADETILNLFGDIFNSAVNNNLEDWKRELRSTVALILVLDQFSRHIYRLQKVSNVFTFTKMKRLLSCRLNLYVRFIT